nr:solute carrier organic anion transporter family member 4A1-like isoform X1 [Ciona intestinalis]XP_026692687.1 solute carrier organic anion transporter family member 4A1-like isoform X2 [Ciona intestinalis]|eukprot:XP_009860360.2 solute carrier organic anion transporter family member 4A1-like isoform X1 [Ciona intestinalis]
MKPDSRIKFEPSSGSEMSQSSNGDVIMDETCGFQLGPKRYPISRLQCFATAKAALAFVVMGTIVQGFLINGHVNVIITTIEKRFDLTSTESGLIASCYDIGACVAVLFVTYMGAHGNKPQWVGWGIALIGVSGILFSLPHFLAPTYTFTLNNNTCFDPETADCTVSSIKAYRIMFYIAFIIAGFGGAPLYSLGITYFDENVARRFSSWYNGILVAGSVIGPGIGFLAGASLLGIYTYPDMTVSITDSSEAWIGAWWMGPLIVGCLGLVVAVPILMLPKTLPGTEKHRVNRGHEMHNERMALEYAQDKDFGKKFRDFPKCLYVLVRNPVYLLVSIGGAVDSILISGLATFGPKYVETIFGLSASNAGIAFGALALVGAAGGQLLGGGLITKFDIGMRGMMRMTYISPFICWFLSAGFLISCTDIPFAGITSPYHDGSTTGSFISSCNAQCGCDVNVYNPVCGGDGVTYYSACFAGCENIAPGDSFTNCSCVSSTSASGIANITGATSGVCPGTGCGTGGLFILFCIILFLLMMCTFLNEASALQISLRCVGFNQRSFAIGVQWLIIRLIGTIPGPLIIGGVFDSACTQWSLSCNVRGACSTYSSKNLSIGIFLVLLVAKVINSILYFTAAMLYKPPTSVDDPTQPRETSGVGSTPRTSFASTTITLDNDSNTLGPPVRNGSKSREAFYENAAFSQ